MVGDRGMGSESKKQVIYAMAGVLVACLLIIASFTTLPLLKPVTHEPSELLEAHDLVYLMGGESPYRINVSFTLYEFTEPLGPGSEADVKVTVTPNYNETVVVRLRITSWKSWWPKGISLADGESEWIGIGELEANVSKTFNQRLKADEIGYGYLRAEVAKWERYTPGEPLHGYIFDFNILVLEDNILVEQSIPRLSPWVAGPRIGIVDDNWRYDWDTWSTPVGVGSEANLTLGVGAMPYENATDITMKILLPRGIELVEGETTWTGDIPGSPGFPVLQIPMRIRTTKLGTWVVVGYLEKDGIILSAPGELVISVFENRTTARRIP